MPISANSLATDAGNAADRPLVRVRGLKKSFGPVTVLDGIDLDVRRSDVVSIIGPSGSGKTTLLRCINALETYSEGSVGIDGVEVGFRDEEPGASRSKRRRRGERELAKLRAETGMVFQLFYLFPHLTAAENVMLGLRKVRGMSKAAARGVAMEWLDRVGLSAKSESLPSQLSGGQQQRVGIARAVAMGPKVLLLDEITSALDPELVGEVLAVVRKLAEDGMTMIMVTHEMAFAREASSRIIFIDDGRVAVEGAPETVFREQPNERLRAFLSRVSHL